MPRTGAPAPGCRVIDGCVPGDSCEQAHVPAQQPPPCQDARVPAADADPGRPRHFGRQAPQGPYPRLGLGGQCCSPPSAARLGSRPFVLAQGATPWNPRGGRSVVALVRFAGSLRQWRESLPPPRDLHRTSTGTARVVLIAGGCQNWNPSQPGRQPASVHTRYGADAPAPPSPRAIRAGGSLGPGVYFASC
jgi:hypothetical protein